LDYLTFIASIVKSIAWPATVVVALFMVRKQLPRLARSLRKLKLKDFEVEFGEAAEELQAEAQKVLPPLSAGLLQASESKISGHATLSRTGSPRGQILEAWLAVESAAHAVLLSHKFVQPGDDASASANVRHLLNAGVLNTAQAAIMEELLVLRNRAVHLPSAEFSRADVNNYQKTAEALTEFLKSENKRLADDKPKQG
jgi:hypothetical protein